MIGIQVKVDSPQQHTCPLCRSDLTASEASTSCASCQTGFHSDCLRELGAGRCGTAGCEAVLEPGARPPAPAAPRARQGVVGVADTVAARQEYWRAVGVVSALFTLLFGVIAVCVLAQSPVQNQLHRLWVELQLAGRHGPLAGLLSLSGRVLGVALQVLVFAGTGALVWVGIEDKRSRHGA